MFESYPLVYLYPNALMDIFIKNGKVSMS